MIIFDRTDKNNTSFETVKGPTFICIHSQCQHNIVLLLN